MSTAEAASKVSQRVYLLPPRFWAATENKSAEEAEALLDKVMHLAEVKDWKALEKFDFVAVEPDLTDSPD